ncbi:MAG: hypothetical protein O3B24_01695 [Verrucomicrobia bacterium]|nr:hypothetical protein [Verrucomicrobiota bacterium]
MTETYTLNELAVAVGKSVPYIRQLQAQLKVSAQRRPEAYPEAYVHFLRRVVALRMFQVPLDDIAELFEKEKKALELLHFDAMSQSPFWYLAAGDGTTRTDRHLLLTGHDLGFPVASGAIQCNLDFRERSRELFVGHEMGEDVRRVLDLYLKLLRKVDERVRTERPVLLEALAWVGNGLLR